MRNGLPAERFQLIFDELIGITQTLARVVLFFPLVAISHFQPFAKNFLHNNFDLIHCPDRQNVLTGFQVMFWESQLFQGGSTVLFSHHAALYYGWERNVTREGR